MALTAAPRQQSLDGAHHHGILAMRALRVDWTHVLSPQQMSNVESKMANKRPPLRAFIRHSAFVAACYGLGPTVSLSSRTASCRPSGRMSSDNGATVNS